MTCKHKFQPRYDQKFPDFMLEIVKQNRQLSMDLPDREIIYVCDVCVKCGLRTAQPARGE